MSAKKLNHYAEKSPKSLRVDLDRLAMKPCEVVLNQINISFDKFANESIDPPSKSNVLKTPQTLNSSQKMDLYSDRKLKVALTSLPQTPKAHVEFSVELKKVIHERNILTSKTRKRVFEALDDIKKKSDEESRHFKREKALLEIINSEIKYVHQLEVIINFFMKPVQERKLLRPEDFQILFGNIQTIYNVNKELLEELDKGPDNVTNAFSKIAPFLKLYSVYAYEFQNILQFLQNARALNPQFAKFVENQESRPEVQNKFSALLITPIQRVPRYKLLLLQLLDLTLPDENGYKNLAECLEKVDDAAEHINKIVDDYENTQRLLELQRRLKSGEPNIIKPGRKLIIEGVLVKMSSKHCPSEKIYTVLMNDIIIFNKMKKEEPRIGSLKCLSIFPLSKCKVIELLDKGCLRIVCQEEEFVLYHDQFNETKNWINKIKDAIDSHMNDRKTLRKDSSSRRPVKRKDLHEYHEVGLSPGRPLKKRKMETETQSVFSKKISKRPPIRQKLFDINIRNSLPPELISKSVFERNHGVPEGNIRNVVGGPSTDTSKELFVFGRPQQNDDSKFGRFFEGVGSTIKKIFGFRS